MSDDAPTASPPNHYAAVLADLKAKRDQINAAIAGLEALMGGIAPTAEPSARPEAQPKQIPPGSPIPPGFFHGMSIPEAARKLLEHKKVNLTNAEIADGFRAGGLVMQSKNILNTINSVLSRRFRDVGDVVKVKRGVWGLKEWHPHVRSRRTNGDDVAAELLGEEEE